MNDMEKKIFSPGFLKKLLLAALLVLLLTFSLYLPALQNGFVNWDDPVYVYENTNIHSIGPEFFRWAFGSFHASNWHPLTWLSHAADHALWGSDPAGHHMTSMIIHALNSFLVVLLAASLFAAGSRRVNGQGYGMLAAAAVTGLLFGLHPLQVESVGWISERKNLLCALFFFLSIMSYIKYAHMLPRPGEEGAAVKGGKGFYVLSLILFVLSIMSKPMAVTLPVVLIILDVYPLERSSIANLFSKGWRILAEKLPFFAVSFAVSALTVIAQQKAMPLIELYPLSTRILVGIRALGFYIIKMVYPAGLAPFYPHPREISALPPDYIAPLLLAAAIAVLSVWSWRRQRKLWAAAWVYYFVTLLPVLGIIQVGEQAAADRYIYLPGIGPMLLAGAGVFWLWEKAGQEAKTGDFIRGSVSALITIVMIFLAALTSAQIPVWKDSLSLWNRQLELYDTAVAYSNRGEAYSNAGEYTKAVSDFNNAVRLQPADPTVYYNRGSAYKILGEYDKALADFDMAVELDPQYAKAYNNRGNVYLLLTKYQEAMSDFNRAVNIDPGYALAYNNRGNIFSMFRMYEKALAEFNKALELDPGYAPAYYNRGNVYLNFKIYEKAIGDYTRAVELDPGYARAYNNRGNVYLRLGKYLEAVDDCTRAIELDPAYTFAYYNRALAYRKMGDTDRANKDFKEAARLGDKMSQEYLESIGMGYQ